MTVEFSPCSIWKLLMVDLLQILDCGLLVESQLQRDMLRRLRFKFATKILLHEINVHARKMLELAKEFDKTNPVENMAIIVDAFKKKEEHSYDIMKLTSVAPGFVKLLKNEFSLSDLEVVLINPYNEELIK
nr:hypothetical protein [Tanacetum cinerariifolium]